MYVASYIIQMQTWNHMLGLLGSPHNAMFSPSSAKWLLLFLGSVSKLKMMVES